MNVNTTSSAPSKSSVRDAAAPCCPPLLAGPLDEAEADELAATLRVLADPVRLRLLSLVAAAPGGEACACDLVAPVGRSQPTVSHHLGLLVAGGLVTREQRGKWAWYRLAPEALAALCRALGAENCSISLDSIDPD